jgi:hypothetical protein
MAPVKLVVLTVTSALGATTTARTVAPELTVTPADDAKDRTSDLAVSPDPDAGPTDEPLLKLPAPATDTVVGALTVSVAPLVSVSVEKT